MGTRARQTQPGSPGLSALELGSASASSLLALAIPRASKMFNLEQINHGTDFSLHCYIAILIPY
jgi:hypothetical protein